MRQESTQCRDTPWRGFAAVLVARPHIVATSRPVLLVTEDRPARPEVASEDVVCQERLAQTKPRSD